MTTWTLRERCRGAVHACTALDEWHERSSDPLRENTVCPVHMPAGCGGAFDAGLASPAAMDEI